MCPHSRDADGWALRTSRGASAVPVPALPASETARSRAFIGAAAAGQINVEEDIDIDVVEAGPTAPPSFAPSLLPCAAAAWALFAGAREGADGSGSGKSG